MTAERETLQTLTIREIRAALEAIGWDGERIEVFGAGNEVNTGLGGWLETPIGRVVLVAAGDDACEGIDR